MMGATQPFISGAISKTVNVPREASVAEIEKAYIESWRLGAKAISIYRDGSKRTQPLNTSKAGVADTRLGTGGVGMAGGVAGTDLQAGPRAGETLHEVLKEVVKIVERPSRRKLPDERHSITHKFDIAGHEGYITVGLFDDGTPGEIFLTMAKEGSTISGFADAFAQAISYALQYGVPLQVLVDKFSHARFEPSGMTKNPEVRFAKSIVDYIFRWMATKFLSPEAQFRAGVNMPEPTENADPGSGIRDPGSGIRVRGSARGDWQSAAAAPKITVSSVPSTAPSSTADVRRGGPSASAQASAADRSGPPDDGKAKPVGYAAIQGQQDAPPCSTCGSIMIRCGSCYKCVNCGTTSGCA
jgi:ribonucleoside-diphosphate reductase alpha chain